MFQIKVIVNLTRFQTLENGKTARTNDIIGKLKKPGIHTETNFLITL